MERLIYCEFCKWYCYAVNPRKKYTQSMSTQMNMVHCNKLMNFNLLHEVCKWLCCVV